MTHEIHKEVKEVFKSDMETAEMMDNLVDDNSPEDISDASIEVAEEILTNVQSPSREKYVYATLFQVGKSVQNGDLADFAAGKLEEWVQKHG